MGLYKHVAVKSFQKNLAYRAANLAGIATNLFFGAVYVLVYRALFLGRGEVGGFTVNDTVTYAVMAQSLLMMMSAFGNRELSEAMRVLVVDFEALPPDLAVSGAELIRTEATAPGCAVPATETTMAGVLPRWWESCSNDSMSSTFPCRNRTA